jgi:hypothetical protein
MKFGYDFLRVNRITVSQAHTSMEPLMQREIFRWLAPGRVPRVLVSYVIGNWVSQ